MRTVTLVQIFDIVNGPIDYINVNISLGQCIKTSLEKISDAINYTSSPFLVDMVYDASGNAIEDSLLVDFTTSMITQTKFKLYFFSLLEKKFKDFVHLTIHNNSPIFQ